MVVEDDGSDIVRTGLFSLIIPSNHSVLETDAAPPRIPLKTWPSRRPSAAVTEYGLQLTIGVMGRCLSDIECRAGQWVAWSEEMRRDQSKIICIWEYN